MSAMLCRGLCENARCILPQEEYNQRHNALFERHEAAKNGLDAIGTKMSARVAKREKALFFLEGLKAQVSLLGSFDEKLWLATGESMTAYSDGSVTVIFKDGSIVTVKI